MARIESLGFVAGSAFSFGFSFSIIGLVYLFILNYFFLSVLMFFFSIFCYTVSYVSWGLAVEKSENLIG